MRSKKKEKAKPRASVATPESEVRQRVEPQASEGLQAERPQKWSAIDHARYQQMYSAACSPGPHGIIALDTERFVRSLANAGLGALAEQELYHLALLAAAEGQPALCEDDVAAALRKAS